MSVLKPPELITLAWCVLGYFFLALGDSGCSIIASMVALTIAFLCRDRVPPQPPAPPRSCPRPAPEHATENRSVSTARLGFSSRSGRD
jgi:hypothetical protein